MKKTALLIIIGLLIAFPLQAKIGVGVGLGKIQIDEPLKPGGIYTFPSVPVLNTGDEPADYEMEITFQHEQPQHKPEANWFSFTPQAFHLEPGQSQTVAVRLILPTKLSSGDYFAYLEAHPIQKAEGVTIGIAAATKTYFTVQAGSVLGAFTERVKSFFTTYSPASFIVLGIIVLIIFILSFRKYFALKFKIERKKK